MTNGSHFPGLSEGPYLTPVCCVAEPIDVAQCIHYLLNPHSKITTPSNKNAIKEA